ncbi:MAG: HNH endonuclease [Acidobacteria bacterium]|jgi:5-methylcytosine-specific restriction endonuclease McrA|nr:HNH endonuclease [Acidobacteriota bacterium]
MEYTLVLNASYEPLNVVHWKKALTLLFQGKVEVVAEHDREIRSVTFTVKLPSILRLLRFVKMEKRLGKVKFSRANIFLRDDDTCQYCGQKFCKEDLTFDHVIPAVQGGTKSWENIVTCCIGCNNKKGGRSPQEAGMHLIRRPKAPKWLPKTLTITIGIRNFPDSWRDYLYWNIELDSQ